MLYRIWEHSLIQDILSSMSNKRYGAIYGYVDRQNLYTDTGPLFLNR